METSAPKEQETARKRRVAKLRSLREKAAEKAKTAEISARQFAGYIALAVWAICIGQASGLIPSVVPAALASCCSKAFPAGAPPDVLQSYGYAPQLLINDSREVLAVIEEGDAFRVFDGRRELVGVVDSSGRFWPAASEGEDS